LSEIISTTLGFAADCMSAATQLPKTLTATNNRTMKRTVYEINGIVNFLHCKSLRIPIACYFGIAKRIKVSATSAGKSLLLVNHSTNWVADDFDFASH